MIVVYTVEPIRGGYVTKIAGDWGSGFAQGRTRDRSVGSAVVLALRNIERAVDDGTLALADVMSISFEEATDPGRKT